jgi:hypothetical protein
MIRQIYQFLHPRFQTLFLEYKVDLKPRYGNGKPPHKLLYEIINRNRSEYRIWLNEALKYKDEFQKIPLAGNETMPQQPTYNNGYLPGLDIIMLYTLVAHYKPRTFFEVGSGNSTKVAFKSIKDNNLETRIVSVDPAPRAEIDVLANTIIRQPFENIDYNEILELRENDILFIDNSHRILPNSDSMVFYLEVLPQLAKGVIVHIHDIYLPYDYPRFMCNRFYSEQYGLAIYLLADPDKYHPLSPNFFISEDEELKSILNPVWENPVMQKVERHGGSFWLVIK